MNEEAFNDSFNLFASQGYNGSLEDYKELMIDNNDAFKDSYNLFKSEGYNGSENEFAELIGVDSTIMLTDDELGKTNDSANADPSVESNAMGSKSEERLSAWQSIKNSFSNLGEQLADVGEFWFTDEGANSSLDIATNTVYASLFGQDEVDAFVERNKDNEWLIEGVGTKDTFEAIKAYEKEKGETKQTLGIIESAKKGDIGGVFAGTVNAVTSMLGSIGYGAGTLGTGFFMDYVAENYLEFNKLKAENLGVSFNDLVLSGEADNAIPIGMGAVSTALEYIGLGTVLKGAKGAVKGTGTTGILGMGSKYLAEKLIYNAGARNTMRMLSTGATEFTTEILQHAADQVNIELGSVAGTENESEVFKTIIDAVTSQEGLEAGLQGFIGGGGMVAGTYSAKSMNTIRSVVDGDKINKDINQLAQLRKQFNASTDKSVQEGIQIKINEKESEIADAVRKGNDIYNSLNDKQISEIESLTDLADAAAYKITDLNKKLRRGEISQSQYDAASSGFQAEYDKARQGLIDMELEKNIKAAEAIAEEKGLGLDIKTTKQVEALMNSDKVSEQNRKEYFKNKDKGFDISAFVIGNKIVIDKDIARKTGSINAGMHEVLHPVLNKLVGNAKEQGKIVRQFRRAMTSSQRRFVDAQMKDRGYTGQKYNTEYINVFSDALRKKQINYDKTTFEKIGSAIVGLFKPVGYTNIGFDSGKDVYNFIKEFDQSAEQGKLTTKAAEALKDVDLSDAGLEGDLQASKTQLEKTKKKLNEIPADQVQSAVNVNKIGAELPSMISTQINNRFSNLDPNTREEFTFDVLEKVLRPNKEGVNKDLQWDGRGDLYGFLNGRIGLRIRDAVREDYKRPEAERMYVGRIDAKQIEDLTREPSTEPTTEAPVRKKTVSTEESVERGKATFSELDIVDEDLINDIKSELEKEIRVRVQKGTLSETVSVKKGRNTYIASWLENYINKQLFKKLLKKLGAISGTYPDTVIPPAYIDFLQDPKTFDIITKALPIKSIKKSYGKLFEIERIGREVTAEGNPIFRIKKIDKTKFFKYFVDGKKSTILERQKQLFREILTPIAKQAVADYATPENLATLNEIKSLAPDTSLDVQADIILEAQLGNLESQLDRYKGEKTGFDIIQFTKTVTAEQKQNISNALTPLLDTPSNNDFKYSVVSDIINGLTDVKTFEDLADLVWNAGNTTLSVTSIREYRAELLSLLANKLNYTDTVKFLISAINKYQKVYKYQQKVIGYDYSLTNFKSDFAAANNIEAKGKIAEDFLRYISRSVRTLKINDITKNSDVYNKIIKPILGNPEKYGITLEIDKKKNRSYILRNNIRLQGLADITRIKSDFIGNVSTIDKEAAEVREWLLNEVKKAQANNDVDSFIGLLSLMSADQRGVIRKMNRAGFAFKNVKVNNAVLEHETEAFEVFNVWKNFAQGKISDTELNTFLDNAVVNLVPKSFDNLLKKVQKEKGLRGKDRYADPRVKKYIAKAKANGDIIQFSKTKYEFDPYDMADVVTMSLFGKTKAFQNREAYMRTYKYLTPAQQEEVKAEMKKHKLLQFSKTINKAKAMVNRPNAPQKGISIWDFDDTLATTKSNVLYTLPDGTKGKINATEFALKAGELEAQGAEFDFSEFSKVMQGAKGPMFDKAVARNKKFGNNNVFILTARPANAKYAIHKFLKGIGLDIKLQNIVGLGDGTAIAKAKWVIGKVAEGYNDFYFADDAYKNVKAVQEVLEVADVKSKVHQAKVQFSKDLNKDFNNIIQDTTGIDAAKEISEAKGKVLGKKKGKFKFFIPPSADDFAGLLYKLTGKGKQGEAHQAWFKEALFDPFAKGIREFESYKQNVTGIVNSLKKSIKNVPEGLKKVNKTGFTNEAAVRVYLWVKNGYDIQGLTKEDQKELIEVVNENPKLKDFADQMDSVLDGYPEPQNDWLAGTITTDAINMINTVKRAEFLEAWQNNADTIFSKENLNKLRAAFGDNYVEALQDMLYRMKTGRNRPSGANRLTNRFMNWVNDSVGTIMFFNTRSALLQTLSTVNFINWGDNNPIAAAKAFANQKQFWSDFAMLFNSDFLKQRRSGLKNDVNADDIANAAETATNKTKAVLSSILKMGFLPTQIADSFAIALGGASFVRNRTNKYISEGMSKQEAQEKAFLDFQEIAEETQQSSRPDRISQQQASPLGRIILAFANTPMQYMRLTKKAFLDLKNGRGDAKTNITKIAYYMAVQNIIFSSLQAALFAAAFDDDEEAIENKQIRVANSMLDSILRGVGVYGAIASTLKNVAVEIKTQTDKDRPDYTVAAQRSLSISPPIDSKMRKLMSAARAFSYKTTREKMVGFGLDNPAFYAGGQILSAATNIPLDRVIRKADNLRVAVDNDTKYWQSIALMLGYSQWDVGLVETSKNKKKKTGFGKTTSWKKSNWKKNWKK